MCRDSGLQFAGELAGHSGRVTDAQASIPEGEPYLLHTSSADGTVRGWDLRSGTDVETFSAPGAAEVACCCSNGPLLAAGARDNVLIWDRRTRKPAASFTDTHAQDVTQVRFHPAQRGALVSGSDDGLIAVFDTTGGLDEDEGFRAGLNIDTAVAKLGFYGASGQNLWCCSGTETLHLWEWAAACDDAVAGGNGPLGQANNARQQIDIGGKHADYLIECSYDAATDRLAVAAGNIEGAAALFPVEQLSEMAGGDLRLGNPVATLNGGHTDIVRSMQWLAGPGSMWLTGGEDSRVCLWSANAGAPAVSQGGSSDSAARRKEHAHMRRASPY